MEGGARTDDGGAEERRWVFGVATLGFMPLLARALRDQESWVAAILGTTLIPIVAAPSSYYFSFLLAFGSLGWQRPLIGAALCALAAATDVIALLVEGGDVRYFGVGVVAVSFVVIATVLLTREPVRAGEDAADRR